MALVPTLLTIHSQLGIGVHIRNLSLAHPHSPRLIPNNHHPLQPIPAPHCPALSPVAATTTNNTLLERVKEGVKVLQVGKFLACESKASNARFVIVTCTHSLPCGCPRAEKRTSHSSKRSPLRLPTSHFSSPSGSRQQRSAWRMCEEWKRGCQPRTSCLIRRKELSSAQR